MTDPSTAPSPAASGGAARPLRVDLASMFRCARHLVHLEAALDRLSPDERARAVAAIAEIAVDGLAIWLVEIAAIPVGDVAKKIRAIITGRLEGAS